jgi:hypothetical protein
MRQTLPTLSPRILLKVAANLPQATQAPLFYVRGGRILLTQIVGEVVTDIQAQETIIKLVSNPTVGADVDLCGTVDINADTAGTQYTITGTIGANMQATPSGAVTAQSEAILVAAGSIDLDTDDDSSTGTVKWTIHYVPFDEGAYVTV